MKQISAVIFIKKDSQRIPGKNFRLFNGRPLYTIILERLASINIFKNIIVDSDSEEILNFVAKNIKNSIPVERPKDLYGGHISGNDLLAHDINFVNTEYIFQTHCTNPLLTKKTITNATRFFFEKLEKLDSLFSVTRIQNRVFQHNGDPVNHEKGKLLRTQDLVPVFVENASFFIFSKNSFYKAGNNRVGLQSSMYEISPVEGIDIDYEFEFRMAELVEANKSYFPGIF